MSLPSVCNLTHKYIIYGVCPWCRSSLGRRIAIYDDDSRRWNVPVMLDSIEKASADERSVIIVNLLLHAPTPNEALPVLHKAIRSPSADFHLLAVRCLLALGAKLLDQEALHYDSLIEQHPEDDCIRIMMIGYYYHRKYKSLDARYKLIDHVMKIISDYPASRAAGQVEAMLLPGDDRAAHKQAAAMWTRQLRLNSGDVNILQNASRFLALGAGKGKGDTTQYN
jgi:hypothetical protein